MKLRIIIGSLEIGGCEKHLSYVLPKLKEYGWQIKVVILSKSAPLAPKLTEAGVIVKKPKFLFPTNKKNLPSILNFIFKRLNIFINITRLCLDFLFDRKSITHFFLPESYILGMLSSLCVLNPSPKLMSRRSLNFYQDKRLLVKWIERKLHRFNNLILGNSKAVVEQLEKEENVPKDKLNLLYNGIDLTYFTHSKIEQRKVIQSQAQQIIVNASINKELENSPLVFVKTANLIPYKGHKDLILALAQIKAELPKNWKLVCVGRGYTHVKQELLDLAKEKNIASNITWLDNVDDPKFVLQKANIGVLCSHQEGFSNAILEKMAVGLPLVVTNAGGNAEAVLDSQNGFVVPIKDPNSLAKALLTLSLDLDLRKKMGECSIERAKTYFCLDKCVANYNAIYSTFLAVKDDIQQEQVT